MNINLIIIKLFLKFIYLGLRTIFKKVNFSLRFLFTNKYNYNNHFFNEIFIIFFLSFIN